MSTQKRKRQHANRNKNGKKNPEVEVLPSVDHQGGIVPRNKDVRAEVLLTIAPKIVEGGLEILKHRSEERILREQAQAEIERSAHQRDVSMERTRQAGKTDRARVKALERTLSEAAGNNNLEMVVHILEHMNPTVRDEVSVRNEVSAKNSTDR